MREDEFVKYIYGKSQFSSLRRAQEKCYLLTNQRGGYSSLSISGSASRNEQVLLMAAVKAPNHWVQFISNIEEIITVSDEEFSLLSQEFVGYTKNKEGFRYQDAFIYNDFPTFHYRVSGVEIEKKVAMKHQENLLLVSYKFENRSEHSVGIQLRPWMRFTKKGIMPETDQTFDVNDEIIRSNGFSLYYKTDGTLQLEAPSMQKDLYFEDDAKDEREAVGAALANHSYGYSLNPGECREAFIMFSLEEIKESPQEVLDQEKRRKMELLEKSGVISDLAKDLVLAADAFVVDRDSTAGKTILAGYPFFGDWGRDTMIAVMGCCIATGRKEETEDIFRSFMKYMKKGIMPNMFPEGDDAPMYNTVDASLLFLYAMQMYYEAFGDLDFIREAYPKMREIIHWYQKGTDYHIRMEEDGLISAGKDLEQVTWMDIRINGVLPTPRHGKPVEINAYWYNGLRILASFSKLLHFGEENMLEELAEKVRESFLSLFWNEKEQCLKDVISGTSADEQVRLNQIYAVSLPYSILPREKEKLVVEKVYRELYTPYGLRSLSSKDPQYKPFYGGSLWNRDMAYHQGTVWAFPLGAYYLSYLKVHEYSQSAKRKVFQDLELLYGTLEEGCLGQIAEIFDGQEPVLSKGCFAQAWSVGELLRAVKASE